MGKGKKTKKLDLIILFVACVVALCVLLLKVYTHFDVGRRIALLKYTKISSAEDLARIQENPDGKFLLTSDIDMSGVQWHPISFTGVLDGDGHSISNLSITSEGENCRETYDGNMKPYSTSFSGFFDVMESATVRNLNFSNAHVEIESDAPSFVGILAGYMDESVVQNCSVQGDVYLRAHDRMFGVGGVVGYGCGRLENVSSKVTLVCIDTDAMNKDEQFLGGLVGAGYPDMLNCTVEIDGYGSEHGYAHNGGALGLYMKYPKGNTHYGQVCGNRVYGRITFFEDNADDRRAYCKALIGEKLGSIEEFEDNGESFRRIEITNYDVDLLPQMPSVSYEKEVSESGYYDLAIHYENKGEDATYSMYVNEHFYKKVPFPKGTGEVSELVYLESGMNNLTFRFQPGDGDITVQACEPKKSDRTVTLIVAPHEDDEILAFAGTIQRTLSEGNVVKVLFLTNGDYYGEDMTAVRLAESAKALSSLGVDRSDITVLGYGDLSLEAMLTCEDPNQVFCAKSESILTYGDSMQNMFDFHTMNTGESASYTAANLRQDTHDYLYTIHPTRVYTTSEYEWHGDHAYAFHLVRETLELLSKDYDYHPILCESVIHGEETTWPEVLTYQADGSAVITSFTSPFPTMDTTLDWEKATKLVLTDEELDRKMAAIGCFVSQNDGGEEYPGTRDYNYAFCKRDEFFWEISY